MILARARNDSASAIVLSRKRALVECQDSFIFVFTYPPTLPPLFPMALREFTDQQATPWRAWDVRLTGARPGTPLPTAPGLESGWICFESAGEKRRLAPIPEGWEVWSEERLRASLAEARAAGRETPPAQGREGARPVVPAPDVDAHLAAQDRL